MPVAPSFSDLIAQFEGEALDVRPTLQFLEGDMALALAHGSAAMGDACIRFTVQAFKETFIDGAKGDALAALVNDHLNIQKNAATQSKVAATFTRTSGGAAGSLPVGFVVGSTFDASGNTVLFTLDAAVPFGAADNGPHTEFVTAQIFGRAGNIGPGLLTRVVDAPFDATLVVANADRGGGGNDEESDPELRVRARNFWQTLRRGTLGALEFGARKVPAVRVARATEDEISGVVTVVVTDSDGNSTAAMVADATTELENWRAAGSTVNVVGGSPLIVDVIGTIIAKDGVDTSVLSPLVNAAVSGRMGKLSGGEILFIDSIKAAAISVDPDAIEAIVLDTPLSNVMPAPGQVIRPGTINLT